MKDPLLLILLVLVGLFLYFITVKGVIYPIMLFAMVVVTALWYFLNHYISQKMVKKARGEESFFFQKAQMVSPDGTELISGALVITESEVVFCSRKGYMGGIKVLWSAFTSSLSSYSIESITEKKMGVSFALKGEKKDIKFVAPKIKEREEELRKALGWE